jgi:hypothetical protein
VWGPSVVVEVKLRGIALDVDVSSGSAGILEGQQLQVVAVLGHYHHRKGQVDDACVGTGGPDIHDSICRCQVEKFGDEAQRSSGACFEALRGEGSCLDAGEGGAPSGCEVVPLSYLCVG